MRPQKSIEFRWVGFFFWWGGVASVWEPLRIWYLFRDAEEEEGPNPVSRLVLSDTWDSTSSEMAALATRWCCRDEHDERTGKECHTVRQLPIAKLRYCS